MTDHNSNEPPKKSGRKRQQPERATCHPDKVPIARGLCWACYKRERRAKLLPPGSVPPPTVASVGASTEALIGAVSDDPDPAGAARRELIAALPEAARALRATLRTDPAKGLALRAAEVLLKYFPIETGDGETGRLLQRPSKDARDSGGGVKIVVGLYVDGGGRQVLGDVVTVEPPSGE